MIDTIINAALRAGRAIMNIYTHPDLDWQVERKADNSPLTLADCESHRVIAEALESTPYPLLSEEGAHLPYDERKDWHSLWIVDPLDGTKEFLKKNDTIEKVLFVCHDERTEIVYHIAQDQYQTKR